MTCIPPKGRGDNNYRKQGIGKALLKAVEEDVREKGAKGLVVWGIILPLFMRASWFKKQGYKKIKREERRKHNEMIKVAEGQGCTHFFFSATDHYYDSLQFANCKQKAKQYDVTASKMYTYFKNPEWRLDPIESYYMPFICKLRKSQTYCRDTGGKWNVYIDPSLCAVPNDSFYEFKEDELIMHHYSFVRDDMSNKLMNAAARVNFDKDIDKILEDINERGVFEVKRGK